MCSVANDNLDHSLAGLFWITDYFDMGIEMIECLIVCVVFIIMTRFPSVLL
jgi:hypothetical protein